MTARLPAMFIIRCRSISVLLRAERRQVYRSVLKELAVSGAYLQLLLCELAHVLIQCFQTIRADVDIDLSRPPQRVLVAACPPRGAEAAVTVWCLSLCSVFVLGIHNRNTVSNITIRSVETPLTSLCKAACCLLHMPSAASSHPRGGDALFCAKILVS